LRLKVTSSNGGTLFLGGSAHVAAAIIPCRAIHRAFDASARLVSSDRKTGSGLEGFDQSGSISKWNNMKNHVDPRACNYVRRFFALLNVPEKIQYLPAMADWQCWNLLRRKIMSSGGAILKRLA
jgi:hypothetical protein